MRARGFDIGALAGKDIAYGSLSYGIAPRVGRSAEGNTKNLITVGVVCAIYASSVSSPYPSPLSPSLLKDAY